MADPAARWTGTLETRDGGPRCAPNPRRRYGASGTACDVGFRLMSTTPVPIGTLMEMTARLVACVPWRSRRRAMSAELTALQAKCTIYEHGIDTVLHLAARMAAHPNRSVRAYTDSIQRVLGPFADPPLAREFNAEMLLPGGVTVSQTIAAFLRRWGEDLEGEDRWTEEANRAAAFSSSVEAARAWHCTDWLVRVHTAAW